MNAFMLWSKERRAALLAQGFSIKEVAQVRRACPASCLGDFYPFVSRSEGS